MRTAKALGCRWVEFDIRLTGDGALVLCHDSRIDRTTDGTGRVAAISLAALRRHDAGGWFGPAFAGEKIPTLDEALALAAERTLGCNVEIKADRGRERETAAALAASLNRRQCPVLVSSFLVDALAEFRALMPDIATGLLIRVIRRGWRDLAARLGCAAIHADHRRLDPRTVDAIRAAGYSVRAYTVNDPDRARVLFDWGVTSVFSDAPDILLESIVEDRRVPGLSGAAAGPPVLLWQGAPG